MSKLKSVLLSGALVVALCHSVHAANSVVIESRTFGQNQPSCSVGVFLNNDVAIVRLDLILELRSTSGRAYFAPPSSLMKFFNRQFGRRLDKSPLGSPNPYGIWLPGTTVLRFSEQPSAGICSGPVSQSWGSNDSSLMGSSPDGIWYGAAAWDGDEQIPYDVDLDSGSDPHRRDSASFLFQFSTNGNVGCFEIDTACYAPAKHLVFINRNALPVPVAFTKGTICIDSACHCYCSGNPHGCTNSEIDIIDVLKVINVAFREQPDIPDLSPTCPYSDTDINCDGLTSILNLTGIIQVAFSGEVPSSVFCNPCQ